MDREAEDRSEVESRPQLECLFDSEDEADALSHSHSHSHFHSHSGEQFVFSDPQDENAALIAHYRVLTSSLRASGRSNESGKSVLLRLDSEDDDESEIESPVTTPRRKLGPRASSLPPFTAQGEADEMIDFDVVKRRSRLKAAKKLDRPSVTKGRLWLMKALLFPVFVQWWSGKLDRKWLAASFVIYVMQFAATVMFFKEQVEFSEVTKFEVKWCLVLLFLVAGLLGHCAAVSSAVNKTIKMESVRLMESPRSSEQVSDNTTYDNQAETSAVHNGGRTESKSPKSPRPVALYHGESDSSSKGVETDTTREGRPQSPPRASRRYNRKRRPYASVKSFKFDDVDSESSEEEEDEESEFSDRESENNASETINNRVFLSRDQQVDIRSRRPRSSPANRTVQSWGAGDVIAQKVKSRLASSVALDSGKDSDLSLSEIRKAINKKIEGSKPNRSYLFAAELFAIFIAAMPVIFRLIRNSLPIFCWISMQPSAQSYLVDMELDWLLSHNSVCNSVATEEIDSAWNGSAFTATAIDSADPNLVDEKILGCLWEDERKCEQGLMSAMFSALVTLFKSRHISTFIAVSSMITSAYLLTIFFQFVGVAEDAFRKRLLYAKYFSKLTSSRRARKAGLPHFRLNRVQHIRIWLDLRSDSREAHNSSYRFADAAANVLVATNVAAVVIVCLRMFSGAWTVTRIDDLISLAVASSLSSYMYRFMNLASRTQKKYDTSKILYTEQLNLYIKIFSNPSNRDELVACNNMLKIAIKLTDEKKPGKDKSNVLLLNPIVYNLLRVTILSALGTISSDLLGFKIRLWKL